jgi:GNAT superfamily N-acetyltransferase
MARREEKKRLRHVEAWAQDRWGASYMVSRGVRRELAGLPGFAVWENGDPVGLLTYATGPGPHEREIVSLDSVSEGRGIGSALVRRMQDETVAVGARRLWLVTSNDNLQAVGFYQRRGFRLVHVHLDAVTVARQEKPSIPLQDGTGIPIRDEWELEWRPVVTDSQDIR